MARPTKRDQIGLRVIMRRISWNFAELSAQSVQSIITRFAAKMQPNPAAMPTFFSSFETTLPKLQAKRLKELERQNAKMKRLVAELVLEKQILKDVAEGNF
jgi:hypothetical protein